MFDIPLDQVCVAGLHVSLGLYQKFFKMLEGDLHDLDLILDNHLASHILHNEDYDPAEVLMDPHLHDLTRYVEAVEQAWAHETEAAELQEEIDDCKSELAWVLYKAGDDDARAVRNAAALEEEIKGLADKKQNLSRETRAAREQVIEKDQQIQNLERSLAEIGEDGVRQRKRARPNTDGNFTPPKRLYNSNRPWSELSKRSIQANKRQAIRENYIEPSFPQLPDNVDFTLDDGMAVTVEWPERSKDRYGCDLPRDGSAITRRSYNHQTEEVKDIVKWCLYFKDQATGDVWWHELHMRFKATIPCLNWLNMENKVQNDFIPYQLEDGQICQDPIIHLHPARLQTALNRVVKAARASNHKRLQRFKDIRDFFLKYASSPGIGHTVGRMVITPAERKFAEEAEKAQVAFSSQKMESVQVSQRLDEDDLPVHRDEDFDIPIPEEGDLRRPAAQRPGVPNAARDALTRLFALEGE
ncbi:hypothetical protein Bbelb_187070 [Branchiostoma belcheri]|nr:hypothetical protein Bbelb_187070 [Branchiostoma belcheri]